MVNTARFIFREHRLDLSEKALKMMERVILAFERAEV